MTKIENGDLVYYPSIVVHGGQYKEYISNVFKFVVDGFTGEYYVETNKNIRVTVHDISIVYAATKENRRFLELLHPNIIFDDVVCYSKNYFLDDILKTNRIALCEADDNTLLIITHKDNNGKYIDRDGGEWENLTPVYVGKQSVYYESYSDNGKNKICIDSWNTKDGYIER